jgi:hypothetical protein
MLQALELEQADATCLPFVSVFVRLRRDLPSLTTARQASRRGKQVTIRLRLTSGATRHGGFVLRRTRRRDELRRASNEVN